MELWWWARCCVGVCVHRGRIAGAVAETAQNNNTLEQVQMGRKRGGMHLQDELKLFG